MKMKMKKKKKKKRMKRDACSSPRVARCILYTVYVPELHACARASAVIFGPRHLHTHVHTYIHTYSTEYLLLLLYTTTITLYSVLFGRFERRESTALGVHSSPGYGLFFFSFFFF